MYDKHNEIEEEAYKMLRTVVGEKLDPDLILKLENIRKDLNTRYQGEYHVDFEPLTAVQENFIVDVKVHTVH